MKRARAVPATVSIVTLTVLVYLFSTTLVGTDLAAAVGGFIPARRSGLLVVQGAAPAWLTPLTATLIHAGIFHLLFNMMMLGFCGKLVEDAIGPRGLVVLYLIGAYAAALAQFLAGPHEVVPMVGASGAASAVLGVYALLYGQQKQAVSHPALNRLINILWLAAAWIGIQLLFGVAGATQGMSIAIAAHIGGFLAGLVMGRPLLIWRYRSA